MPTPFDPWKMTKIFAVIAAIVAIILSIAILQLFASHGAVRTTDTMCAMVFACIVAGGFSGAFLLLIGSELDRMRLKSYAIRQGAPQRIHHHQW